MCGIAGLVASKNGRSLDLALVERLASRLAHRGPDDSGSRASTSGAALLAHRRLSIIDLSPGGHQPMSTPDGRWTIVFNGEIYNYVELRAELAALGHPFRTQSDTEVLLEAWREWGPRALDRLVGMFAFALLDEVAGRVFLARDPFGIKPLYYARVDAGIAFASEIPALLEVPGLGRRVNARKLHDYLVSSLTDDGAETLFADVRQLAAGHYAEIALDTLAVETRRWFRIDLEARSELGFERAAEHLRELFLESIRLHMRSDVPVGAALSGGIDSSAIVMAMRRLDARAEVHTFSYIADDPSVSEERWVDVVGAASGAKVHKVSPTPAELAADLDVLIRCQGEPFGSTSIYAQHRVFRLAREAGIKVMLDGQGADELLAGYVFYGAARVESLLRQGRVRDAVRFVRRASALPGRPRLWRSAARILPGAVADPLRWVAARLRSESSAIDARWFRERGVLEVRRPGAAGADVLRHALHEGLTETSVPMLLRYEDRNSMHHSIESRVPFLTPAIARFVLSLPEEFLLGPDGTTKRVFRAALRGLVPDPILDRKDKIGFATPEKRWLEAVRPWAEGILGSETARRIPALDRAEVERQWRGALAGELRFDFRLWRWINLVRWAELFQVAFD